VSKVTARVRLVDGLQFVGTGGDSNHSVVMDSIIRHGGTEAGVRPMEMLLMGLGGCMGMAAISILRKKRQQVTGFEVHLKGNRSESGTNPLTDIALEFSVSGTNIDAEAVERALELSYTKYCPVGTTIKNGAKIEYTYKVREENLEDAKD
jgi:putative redox protein